MLDSTVNDRHGTSEVPGLERVVVALLATAGPAIVLSHGLATVLRAVMGSNGAPHVFAIALAVAGAGAFQALLAGFGVRFPRRLVWLGAAASTLVFASAIGSWSEILAVALGAAAQAWGAQRLHRALPATLVGARGRRPLAACLWTLLAALAVVQVARLSAYSADRTAGWFLTTGDSWYVGHMCVSAYVYAADLHRQGEANLYDQAHLETVHTDVENLAPHVEDPFLYPPPFLLLPLGALALTNDFLVLRSLWFALQTLGFLAVAVWLARWVGGAPGRAALWALPAIFAAVPTLQNLQFGQAHLAVYALTVAAMLCFETRRRVLGGALLASAIVAKIFPGILLLFILLKKRTKDAAMTVGWTAAILLVTWAALGQEPFVAFAEYQFPLMMDGEVITPPDEFEERAPWLASNLSMMYFPQKLMDLGLPMPPRAGAWLTRVYGLLMIAFAWHASRRRESRVTRAVGWLALLNLFVLSGGGAWVEYVPATSLWLLALLAEDLRGDRRRAVLLGGCWFVLFLPVGLVQIGDTYPSATIVLVCSVVFAALLVGVNAWAALRQVVVTHQSTD